MISIVSMGLVLVQNARATARIEAANQQRDRAAALANLTFQEAQKEDYQIFHDKVEAFDLGDAATVRPGAPLSVAGRVRYPRSCANYWLLFSEARIDGITVIWPQLAIRNSGLLSQVIEVVDYQLRVPREMEREGEIVLACVDQDTHEELEEWRRQGNTGPLLERDLEVVLRTVLTIDPNP